MMHKQGCNADGELLRDVYVEHDPVNLAHADDGMTREEFKDECDINVLMAHYERTGVLNFFNPGQPQFLDVSAVPDLQSALHYMDTANTAFMSLPASVRREFDQDPLKFVDFATDPSNLSRMREWGLAPPAVVADAIAEATPVPPTTPKPVA
ncbi:internal scaffolding protein [Blackfly microvirus SF02]|uniref:Internal scaffolding protein n=1 Tax=Blackfly microvirus SF02 TaxID=2576452 RepID=A0A4V1F5D3_9VIRU|nr:internal scaffolding protein [Blackfly microvirus SF02]